MFCCKIEKDREDKRRKCFYIMEVNFNNLKLLKIYRLARRDMFDIYKKKFLIVKICDEKIKLNNKRITCGGWG